MNMYPPLDAILNALPEQQPAVYRAIYPKRIVPPNGFLNPRYFALTLLSELYVGFNPEMKMLPHITGTANALLQLEYRVPTYFIRSEFAQAVAQTEPPADFKFSEIMWPLPAMLFVLPTEFVLKYFGFLCPFLSVTRTLAGVYPDILKNLPNLDLVVADDILETFEPRSVKEINKIDSRVDRFNVVYPVYTANQAPLDYTGSYPLSLNVSEVATAPFVDATYMEEEALAGTFAGNGFRASSEFPAEGEQERAFNNKVQSFAAKLMLALTARPKIITMGGLQRPTKIKKGKVHREELWHPNLIGWEYRAKRPPITGEHGTHASPRMHWRIGHMRLQPYGPKPWTETTPTRLVWIEPVLVNAPQET